MQPQNTTSNHERLREKVYQRHCHVLLERLPESRVPENNTLHKTNDEMGSDISTSERGRRSRQKNLPQNEAGTNVKISLRSRQSRQDKKGKKPLLYSSNTPGDVSKVGSDSALETVHESSLNPNGGRKNQEIKDKSGILYQFKKLEDETKPSACESSKSFIRFGCDFYVTEFKNYLLALRNSECSEFLQEVVEKNKLNRYLSFCNKEYQTEVNKALVEWIIKKALKVEEVQLDSEWEKIKFSVDEAERQVMDTISKGEISRNKIDVASKRVTTGHDSKINTESVEERVDEILKDSSAKKENPTVYELISDSDEEVRRGELSKTPAIFPTPETHPEIYVLRSHCLSFIKRPSERDDEACKTSSKESEILNTKSVYQENLTKKTVPGKPNKNLTLFLGSHCIRLTIPALKRSSL